MKKTLLIAALFAMTALTSACLATAEKTVSTPAEKTTANTTVKTADNAAGKTGSKTAGKTTDKATAKTVNTDAKFDPKNDPVPIPRTVDEQDGWDEERKGCEKKNIGKVVGLAGKTKEKHPGYIYDIRLPTGKIVNETIYMANKDAAKRIMGRDLCFGRDYSHGH